MQSKLSTLYYPTIPQTLHSVLGTLTDYILTVLKRAFDDDDLQDSCLKEWIQTVLGSIAILEDHVSLTVLHNIVGIDVDDAGSVLDRLGSVILMPEDQNDEVRVLHGSFSQFLVDKQRCTDEIFYIDASVHHGRLAVECLNIMMTKPLLVENICRLEDILLPKSDIPDLQDRINNFIPEHLRYAYMHWAMHLSKSKLTLEITKLLVEFTSTKLLAWVEVLIYLKRLDIAVTASIKARKWLLENDASTKMGDDMAAVPDIMNDVKRFVLRFFSLIDECTGHIYNTALPFSPSCKHAALYSSTNTPDHVHRVTHMTTPRTPTWGPLLRVIETDTKTSFAAFSPDGLFLASSSTVVQIWDATTGMLKKTMVGDIETTFWSLAWAPDRRHIVSCSTCGSAQVWNTASGAQVHVQDIQDQGYQVAWNPNGTQIVVAAEKLHVLTITLGKDIKVTKVVEIENVQAISKNANHAISIQQIGCLCVWDIAKGNFKLLEVPEDWSCEYGCVEFLNNDTQIIAYGEDMTIKIWDLKTGELIYVHEFQRDLVCDSLTVSPHGDLVAIYNQGIYIWDPRTQELLDMLTDSDVIPWSFSSDNERLVSQFGNFIKVWDLTQRPPKPPKTISSGIGSIEFSTDGSRIAVATGGRVCVLCPHSGLQLYKLQVDTIFPPSFSPDAEMLAIHTFEGVQIWDLSSTEPSQPFFSVPASMFAWSPNSRWLAVHASNDVKVFDTKTGALTKSLKVYETTWHTCSLEFSHDSTILYFKFGEVAFRWEEGTCINAEERRWNKEMGSSSGYHNDNDGWIRRRKDGRRMCWLPTSRRGTNNKAEASSGDYYAVGSDTGDVTILYFGTDPGRAVVDTHWYVTFTEVYNILSNAP